MLFLRDMAREKIKLYLKNLKELGVDVSKLTTNDSTYQELFNELNDEDKIFNKRNREPTTKTMGLKTLKKLQKDE